MPFSFHTNLSFKKAGFFLIALIVSVNLVHAQSHNRIKHKRFDSASLAITDTLSTGDYLAEIEKVYQIFNNVPVELSKFSALEHIATGLENNDSALIMIKRRLKKGGSTANLQNLQMFANLLDELRNKTVNYSATLDRYDTSMDRLGQSVLLLRKDTILYHIISSPALTDSFDIQLQELNDKKLISDSLIKQTVNLINHLRVHASSNIIAIDEMILKINGQLKTKGYSIFSKEVPFLWEAPTTEEKLQENAVKLRKGSEWRMARFYFLNIKSDRFILLVLGILFLVWITFNLNTLKRLNRLEAINEFGFSYIIPYKILSALLIIVTLAPLYDLNAPVIYTELLQLLLLTVLTIEFYKRLSGRIFFLWIFFCLIFISLFIIRWLELPPYEQRIWIFISNITAVLFGIIAGKPLLKGRNKSSKQFLIILLVVYIICNLLAAITNLIGRFTLTQLFYSTGIYAFSTALALYSFSRIFTEAFLLQIKTSRIRKKYPEKFDWNNIEKGLSGILYTFSAILWLVELADNLNIYDIISDYISALMNTTQMIGTFSFTLGGVFLFIIIIWISNFLQKYIAFFFGDTGDETWDDNKGQRSRLLITRLLLLVAGFFLAVAASGLPMDRITVILGALGIGIGLGLQSLVNSLVSGVMLIFDRTIRIGDIVEISDKKGRVKEISVRASTLLTDDGAEIIIPNGDILSHNIINYTLSNNQIRTSVQFTVLKPFQTETLIALIQETVILNPNVFVQKQPGVIITGITSKTAVVKVSFWCKNISKTEQTESEVSAAIYENLETKGFQLA